MDRARQSADVRVRLRVSPFSPGTVKISPWASNTARAPLGERAAFCISSGEIVAICGARSGNSPWI